MFNLQVFRQLNGFDENIFLYYEEMDLSVRADEHGIKMYYAENIFFPHNSKQSVAESETLDKIRNWHFQWSSLYYKKKHRLWIPLIESILVSLLVSPFKQFAADKYGAEKYRLKRRATLDFLRGKKAFFRNGEPFIPD
ncbi:MAG: hypothetical protein HKO71_00930 [Pseudomonadales bacterium]|nr:hypothetical protein [Pseudomonadales bacterium]